MNAPIDDVQWWDGTGPQVRARLIAVGRLKPAVPGSRQSEGVYQPAVERPRLELDALGRREVRALDRDGLRRHWAEQERLCGLWWRAHGRPEPSTWISPDYYGAWQRAEHDAAAQRRRGMS